MSFANSIFTEDSKDFTNGHKFLTQILISKLELETHFRFLSFMGTAKVFYGWKVAKKYMLRILTEIYVYNTQNFVAIYQLNGAYQTDRAQYYLWKHFILTLRFDICCCNIVINNKCVTIRILTVKFVSILQGWVGHFCSNQLSKRWYINRRVLGPVFRNVFSILI